MWVQSPGRKQNPQSLNVMNFPFRSRGESFVHSGEKLKLPDDMTIGAIIGKYYCYRATKIENGT